MADLYLSGGLGCWFCSIYILSSSFPSPLPYPFLGKYWNTFIQNKSEAPGFGNYEEGGREHRGVQPHHSILPAFGHGSGWSLGGRGALPTLTLGHAGMINSGFLYLEAQCLRPVPVRSPLLLPVHRVCECRLCKGGRAAALAESCFLLRVRMLLGCIVALKPPRGPCWDARGLASLHPTGSGARL